MSEIIQLFRYENTERLGSDFLSNKNDHWNSNLTKNRSTCVFIGSFSISGVAIFSCVIDKQYDSLSDLIISFGTAENQITFYRLKYWNTKSINYFLSVPACSQNMVVYIVNMFIIWDNRPWIQAIGGGGGCFSIISVNPDISRVWSMDPKDRVITGFHCSTVSIWTP